VNLPEPFVLARLIDQHEGSIAATHSPQMGLKSGLLKAPQGCPAARRSGHRPASHSGAVAAHQGECNAIVAVPNRPNGQAYNRRAQACGYLPGYGPTKTVLVDNGPPVKIYRDGERPPSYGGDAWKLIGIVALPIAIGMITSGSANGGPKKYVDGYLDLPPEPKRCRGETPDGCELRVVDVPRQDGGTARACVRYCPRPDEIDDEPLPLPTNQPPVVYQTPNVIPPFVSLPKVGTPPLSTPVSRTWIEPPTKATRPLSTPVSTTWIEPMAKGTRP
jgi:hypothetical protein